MPLHVINRKAVSGKQYLLNSPYLPEGINREYLRWLYTAVTRAKETLYLIGFKDDYFED